MILSGRCRSGNVKHPNAVEGHPKDPGKMGISSMGCSPLQHASLWCVTGREYRRQLAFGKPNKALKDVALWNLDGGSRHV
jgi:hypothetical protein